MPKTAQWYYTRIYSMAPPRLQDWMHGRKWQLLGVMRQELGEGPLPGGQWGPALHTFLPGPEGEDAKYHDAAKWANLQAWLDKYAKSHDEAMTLLSLWEEQPMMRLEAGAKGPGLTLDQLAQHAGFSPQPRAGLQRAASSAEIHALGEERHRFDATERKAKSLYDRIYRRDDVPRALALDPHNGVHLRTIRRELTDLARKLPLDSNAWTYLDVIEQRLGLENASKWRRRRQEAVVAHERPIELPTVGPHTKGRNPICTTASPMFDSEGREYHVEYKVVPLAQVRASNEPGSFAPTPGYPAAFQSRDLSSVGEMRKIRKIAQSLDPDRLIWASLDPTIGAPVVWENPTDGYLDVLGGNGRTIAVKMAPEERYAAYATAVQKQWPGLWGRKGGDKRLLVRVVTWPDGRALSESEAVQLGAASQASTAAAETPLGRAMSVMRSLGITDISVLPPISNWTKRVDADNIEEFQQENGAFWRALLSRMDDARQAMYEPATQAAELVQQVLVGYLPPQVRAGGFGDLATENAILASLPMMVSLEQLIAQGRVKPEWSLLRQLPEAMLIYRALQRKGVAFKDLETLLEQEAMQQRFAGMQTLLSGSTLLGYYLAVALYKASRRANPAKTMEVFLEDYYRAAIHDDPAALQMAEAPGGLLAFGAKHEADPARALRPALGLRREPSQLPDGMRRNPHRRRNRGNDLLDSYNLEVFDVDPRKAAVIAQHLAQGIEAAADLCSMHPPVCVGNLGIARRDMPQLGDVTAAFVLDLQQEGVPVTHEAIAAGRLMATQREIQASKAHNMAGAMMKGKWDPAKAEVLVSSDGYILDGHHRWAALVLAAPHRKMHAIVIDLPIRALLARAMRQPGVKRADLEGRPVPLDEPIRIPSAA